MSQKGSHTSFPGSTPIHSSVIITSSLNYCAGISSSLTPVRFSLHPTPEWSLWVISSFSHTQNPLVASHQWWMLVSVSGGLVSYNLNRLIFPTPRCCHLLLKEETFMASANARNKSSADSASHMLPAATSQKNCYSRYQWLRQDSLWKNWTISCSCKVCQSCPWELKEILVP